MVVPGGLVSHMLVFMCFVCSAVMEILQNKSFLLDIYLLHRFEGENSFSASLASEGQWKCVYKHQHFWHCNC